MAFNPNWNGDRITHMRQYELMGDSILHGRLDLDVDVDPALKTIENPYDREAREAAGINAAWDHSYYNGHYYMYFGVVPVLLLFAPYQAVVGHPLRTYHATQLFTAIIIVGIFVFFWYLRKKFFSEMKWLIYVLLATAASLMTVWYAIDAPSLYCTAITAAITCEIWSIYLFVRAVQEKKEGKSPYIWLVFGSLLGALAFGCRPTIALANLIIIPVYFKLIKAEKQNFRSILKLLLTLIPYAVIGVLLMWYNYARFGSIFEFGQSYQLTVADIASFSKTSFMAPNIFNALFEMVFRFDGFYLKPPFIYFAGVLWEYPLFLLSIIGLFIKNVRKKLGDLKSYVSTFLITVLLIIVSIAISSPLILERYHMDINFLLGIIGFMVVGSWKKLPTWVVYAVSILTIILCFLLFLVPNDLNFGSFLFR